MSKYYCDADLVHVPHFNIPWSTKAPLIVTIHDLIHFQFKEYKPFAGALLLLKQQLYRAANTAKCIIAVSYSTRLACEQMFPTMKSKLRVVYEASDETLSTPLARPSTLKDVRYILCVGSVREHKNIHGVLKAFESISQQDPEIRLVIVGKLDKRFEVKHRFKSYVASCDRIIHVDNADDKMLIQYYQHAECLIAASFIEGFGLPVIEAMQSGTPCVVSEATSLEEVAGGAAITFNPKQPMEIAKAVLRVLQDSVLQSKMRSDGLKRAEEFSWKKCAQETLALYDEALQ